MGHPTATATHAELTTHSGDMPPALKSVHIQGQLDGLPSRSISTCCCGWSVDYGNRVSTLRRGVFPRSVPNFSGLPAHQR